jgi:hypothetical protein
MLRTTRAAGFSTKGWGIFAAAKTSVLENRDAPAELAQPSSVPARLAAAVATPSGHHLPNPEKQSPRSAARYATPTPSADALG